MTAPLLQDYIKLSPVANIEALNNYCYMRTVYRYTFGIKELRYSSIICMGIMGKNESIIGRIYEHKGIA